MRHVCVLLLALAGAWAGGGHVQEIRLTAVDRSALCLDGSPGLLYFRPSPSGSRNWLLNLEGGGWCFTEADCWKRSKGQYGSSTHPLLSKLADYSGPLSSNCRLNPGLCEYNAVSFKYCDGNSFAGDRADPVPFGGDRLYMRGFRILNAGLAKLLDDLGLSAAQDVLLTVSNPRARSGG